MNNDCLSIICRYLCPKDILNLLGVLGYKEKIFNFNIKESYLSSCRNSIDNWFRNFFGENYEIFRREMIDSGSLISGSFVLQNILDENWNESDIDIFFCNLEKTPHEYPLCYFLFALENKYKVIESRDIDMSERLGAYSKSKYEIRRVLEYEIKTKKFQCIHLNTDTISGVSDFINNFDFNFCKSVFYYDENGPHLSVPFFEEVMLKKTKISSINESKSSTSRREKYTKRGFSFLL